MVILHDTEDTLKNSVYANKQQSVDLHIKGRIVNKSYKNNAVTVKMCSVLEYCDIVFSTYNGHSLRESKSVTIQQTANSMETSFADWMTDCGIQEVLLMQISSLHTECRSPVGGEVCTSASQFSVQCFGYPEASKCIRSIREWRKGCIPGTINNAVNFLSAYYDNIEDDNAF